MTMHKQGNKCLDLLAFLSTFAAP